ncbi:hypothetical protein REPUB_Repub06bG0205400 [Reevesia pubescens]
MSTSGKPRGRTHYFLEFMVKKHEGVTDLKPDGHVMPMFTGECKDCAHCKSKKSNVCDLLRINTDMGVMLNNGETRFSINVCILSCGISTGLDATLNVAKPLKDSTVTVFGLGVVGLTAAGGARIAGASRIIGVDINSNRFEGKSLLIICSYSFM